MAQKGFQLDRNMLCCYICLDLLKDPVTVACGHSYCRNCIKRDLAKQDKKKICPQCRHTFAPRPVMVKSTMLADLVGELKKTGLQAAPADHCYARPGDVACDFCSGIKLKALKSCLVCVASYCEKHLQPHCELPVFKKHKLVEPSKKLQENLCSFHGEVMNLFCRTDQQCICYFCFVNEHKGHNTVSAAAEWTERQKELEESLLNIQQKITDREKDVKVLQQQVEDINGSADKSVEHSEKTFTELIRQVRSKQETEVGRVKDLQEMLEQEITDLKRREAELKKMSDRKDQNQFLNDYRSLPPLSESTHSSSIDIRPLRYFEDVTAAVSEAREKLQDVLRETWTDLSLEETQVDVSLPQPEPKTRADFLRYSRKITLDPNTANTCLLLSEGNKKATVMRDPLSYSSHPDRFTCAQVLSKERLTGRCYFEVEWTGMSVYVAVAYKDISRTETEGVFGLGDNSWALRLGNNRYAYVYNKVWTTLGLIRFPPLSPRVGVYLDHSAGVLSFYRVSETMTMTLEHTVQTTFTEPLYAGLWLNHWAEGESAGFIKLK